MMKRFTINPNLCPSEKTPTSASAAAGSGDVDQRRKKRFDEKPSIKPICGGTSGSPNAARRLSKGIEICSPVPRRISPARSKPVTACVIKVE